ncbi:MAG: hypothetical protein N5P05_002418 [Chroococcopsis gigantea SAG 12.99]|jgi:N-acetylglucosaminyl-diphospho-decaprenol L-rhamnosyltransferase|nr:hypothetical protein [Chroococcopsis gigantea SAG 12.99]
MSLLIVILNYKTAQLTIDCLESLVDEVKALPSSEVVVVDNASGDGSGEKIAAAIEQNQWQDWAKLIVSPDNGGYAAGNNIAIRPALAKPNPPDYILLLNPDTVVRPSAIEALVNFMNEHPGAGIAGSRLEDPDGTAQHSAFRFLNLGGELEGSLRLGLASKLLARYKIAPEISDSACQTDWVAGASMIIRRAVFDKIGLLDEEYFMYYEELDFCLQAHRAGWECWYVPASRVVHLVGQSSGVTLTKEQPKRRPLYWFDSRRRFYLKNHGKFYLWMANLVWAVGFFLWRVRRNIQRKPDLDPPYLLSDFIKYALGRGSSTSSEKLGLCQQIKEDWIAHGRDWTKPGFRAVAVQRFGQWRMTVEPKLLRAPLSIIYRFFYRYVRNVYGIDLPYTVQLGRRVIIEHQSAIIIHGYSQIGDDCILRQGVTLGNRYLERPFEAPKLGKKVNVGAGAKLLGGLAIGDHVNIGANAVVLCDIPDGHTAIGIPAKVIPPKIKSLTEAHI